MSKTRKLLIASIFLIALPAHATLIEATFSVDLPVFTEPNLDPLDQLFTANSITQLIGTARWDSADIPSYCAAGCSISPLATENTFATNIDSLFDTSPQWFNLITGPDVPNGIKLRLNLISWKILIGDADGVGSARGASYTLSLSQSGDNPLWNFTRTQRFDCDSRRECQTTSYSLVDESDFNVDYRVVPAPSTLALFGIGLAGLGWSRRKKA
jgi:hypothetical protein